MRLFANGRLDGIVNVEGMVRGFVAEGLEARRNERKSWECLGSTDVGPRLIRITGMSVA